MPPMKWRRRYECFPELPCYLLPADDAMAIEVWMRTKFPGAREKR